MLRTLKIRRRTVLGGLAVSAVATVLCASRGRAQSAPTKVTFGWPFAEGEATINNLAKRFTEQKRSIEIEVQPIPQVQVIPKLTTAFAGGSAPDCLGMSDAWLAQFAKPGWLEKLDDRLAASGLDRDLSPASMAIARMVNNTAYYAGQGLEAYVLYYNRKLFAEAGLKEAPADIEQFRSNAMKLTDASLNRFGYYVLGGSGWQFQQWATWMVRWCSSMSLCCSHLAS
jgi:multiple sugar transport system substrate-binding protein